MTTLAEEVEMALDAAGVVWARREDSWAVPSAGDVVREIRVTLTDSGIHLDAVLIEWDEATAESHEALALFLKRAERDVAGVACFLDGTQARLRTDISVEQIESRLGEVLPSMSAGCRLLAAGARALLSPELARQYLSFLGEKSEK